MKRLQWIGFVILAVLVAGCAGRAMAPQEAPAAMDEVMVESAVAFEPEMDVEEQNLVGASGEPLPKMIIYTGDLSLVVKDTIEAQDEIGKLVDDMDGYILSAQSYAQGEGLRRIQLTLRVPAEEFNSVMSALRAMAMEVERDSVSSDDVTQEYVDLESRLTALEAKAERLQELMDQAEDTESVLAVYEELSRTQQEIEQVKGRMRYLERSAAMSTITVTLVPDELSRPVEIAGWRPGGTLKRAIEALVSAFQFLVDALIWVVIVVLPVVIFIGLVIFGFIRLLRLIFGGRRRKAKVAEDAESLEEE